MHNSFTFIQEYLGEPSYNKQNGCQLNPPMALTRELGFDAIWGCPYTGRKRVLGARMDTPRSHHQVVKIGILKICCFFTHPVTNLYNLASLKFFVYSQEKYCHHVEALEADCTVFGLT